MWERFQPVFQPDKHGKMRTVEKSYECQLYGKPFHFPSILRQQEKTHIGGNNVNTRYVGNISLIVLTLDENRGNHMFIMYRRKHFVNILPLDDMRKFTLKML